MNKKCVDETTFEERCAFLVQIGIAAHTYGATASRLENYLTRISQTFGLSGNFSASPTEILFTFQKEHGFGQHVELVKLTAGGLDLDKLACLGELVDSVIQAQVTVPTAKQQLAVIAQRKEPWGNQANFLSYIGVGAGIAVLFSGSWWDVGFAAVLSALVFFMLAWSPKWGARTAQWLPLSTAFVCGLLAAIGKLFVPELNLVIVIVSSIIILVPGYPISLGIAELVAQKAVSGLANLMSGLVYLAKQVAGAWLGVSLIVLLFPTASHPPGDPVQAIWLWLFMPFIILGLCVVFQTSRRDFAWAVLGCVLAYFGILVGSALLDGDLGNLFGTVVAVVFSNLWSQKTDRPTSIILLPAIVLLVSGSIGFRGLAAMAQGQMLLGEQQFLQMGVVALTIVAGVMIGNTLVKSESSL